MRRLHLILTDLLLALLDGLLFALATRTPWVGITAGIILLLLLLLIQGADILAREGDEQS